MGTSSPVGATPAGGSEALESTESSLLVRIPLDRIGARGLRGFGANLSASISPRAGNGALKTPEPSLLDRAGVRCARASGANLVAVAHATIHSGDRRPECRQGKVYCQKEPATLVRFVGHAPLEATVRVAYRVRDKTVVRFGYGIYWNTEFSAQTENELNPPFLTTENVFGDPKTPKDLLNNNLCNCGAG